MEAAGHKQNLVLTGFMGSGKTTIGRMVARRLCRTFVDMDHELADRNRKDIVQMFSDEGEDGFRRREAALCRELAGCGDLVIATGGGAVVAGPWADDNRRSLEGSGVMICLGAGLEELRRRLSNASVGRPLLSANPDALAQLADERAPGYAGLSLHVDTTGRPLENVVDQVLTLWSVHSAFAPG